MLADPSEPPRSRDLLATATVDLQNCGIENPRLEAEVLLAEVLQSSRTVLLIDSDQRIDPAAQSRFTAMVCRRKAREPLAYIIGHKEFYSLDLEVTPEVLIPRPETETVVAAALDFLSRRPTSRVLDLGTGSGAIALAIAANAPAATLTASDLSAEALEVAHHNASRLLLDGRISFRLANCFEPIDGDGNFGRFDLILSNPPYIRDAEIAALQPEVADWEPRLALTGGHDGLSFYRRIADGSRDHLAPDGTVIVEVGADQADAVAAIFSAAGLNRIDLLYDLSGIARVVRAAY